MRFLILGVLLLQVPLAAQAIQLRSGQSLPGQQDPSVRFLLGPNTGGFGFPFTASDFQAARTGPNAMVRTTLAGWPKTLPSDPTARWIDTIPGDSSGLFAIDFTVTRSFQSAQLRIDLVADDALGEAATASANAIEGLYLNGKPIPYTANLGVYYQSTLFDSLNVGPLLVNGTNTLYVYLVNTGGAGGLLFSADLDFDRAASQMFGVGCKGSAGTPFLVQRTAPKLGTTQLTEIWNVPANASVFAAFATDRTQWQGLPLPLDLTPFGMTGCQVFLAIQDTLPTTNFGGVALLGFPVPNNPYLIGLEVYFQAIVPDPGINPTGVVVSDAVGMLIGS